MCRARLVTRPKLSSRKASYRVTARTNWRCEDEQRPNAEPVHESRCASVPQACKWRCKLSLVNNPVSTESIRHVLGSIRNKGVKLWAENGRLHYKAPKGTLTRNEIEQLRASTSQLVALLENGAAAQSATSEVQSRVRPDRAPLTSSQLEHWHFFRLAERPAIRQVASAMRLRGVLSVDALRETVAEMVRRHEALRTRIILCDGVPMQEIAPSAECDFRIEDLTQLAESLREVEVKRTIEQLILEPIDVAVGPLFGARLVKLSDQEHVLVVAMEHIVSDGFSLNILMRDIQLAYAQAAAGRAFSLPAIPVRFADFAIRQHSASRAADSTVYWSQRLSGCQRLRFPEQRAPDEARSGWATVSVKIGKDVRARLIEWARARRTTLVMSTFTAYVALVFRWCNVTDAVFRYQSHGRDSSKLENTIGFFAFPLYLRIQTEEGDRFTDLMRRVTEEYCNASAHADLSYIVSDAPRPEFTLNSSFNWLPQRSVPIGVGSDARAERTLTCSPVRFAHPMLRDLESDREPSFLFIEEDDEIVVEIYFPQSLFSIDGMERLGRNLAVFIDDLLRHPEGRVRDVMLR
jgi:hypothetical protein